MARMKRKYTKDTSYWEESILESRSAKRPMMTELAYISDFITCLSHWCYFISIANLIPLKTVLNWKLLNWKWGFTITTITTIQNTLFKNEHIKCFWKCLLSLLHFFTWEFFCSGQVTISSIPQAVPSGVPILGKATAGLHVWLGLQLPFIPILQPLALKCIVINFTTKQHSGSQPSRTFGWLLPI